MKVKVANEGNESIITIIDVTRVLNYGGWSEIVMDNDERKFIYDDRNHTFYEIYPGSRLKMSSFVTMEKVYGYQVYDDSYTDYIGL